MFRPLLAALSLAAVTAAQQVIVPENMYFTNSSSSTSVWRTTAFHLQLVYDSSHFTAQGVSGPVSITRLRFRPPNNTSNAGGSVYTGATVQMSSCPLDYSALSTTFANNRGTDNTTVFSGNVTTLAAAGTTPNSYTIDIALTTPFVYDPTLGLDLVVEVDAPAPAPTSGVTSLACSSSATTHKARRLSAGTQTATTGTLSDLAGVVLIDFTGPGGWSAWAQPENQNTGIGCYTVARSFYEENTPASAMDLSNRTLTLTPNLAGGYDVTLTNGSQLFPHGPVGLMLGDDQLGMPVGLPFTFGHPAGTTTFLQICSNGFLWLDATSTGTSGSPTGASFMAGVPRVAPFWTDLVPDGATNIANVFFDVDPSFSAVYITWDQVPAAGAPGNVSTFQVKLDNLGGIEFRYGACAGGSGAWLAGYSGGSSGMDPGSRDLSAFASFRTTATETPGLSLSANTARLGQSLVHTLSNIPTGAVLSARLLGFREFNPGLDLGIAGAPGCKAFLDVSGAFNTVLLGRPTAATAPFTIPSLPSLVGLVVYAQGVSLVPGINALGLVTSNQNKLTLGNG